MKIDLEKRVDNLASVASFDQVVRAVSMDSLGQRVFTNIEAKLADHVLDIMLMGARLDNVIVIEDKKGDYEVIRGHELVATALYIYQNRESLEPRYLARRLMHYELQCVVYRTTMDRTDAAFLIHKQYGIEVAQ